MLAGGVRVRRVHRKKDGTICEAEVSVTPIQEDAIFMGTIFVFKHVNPQQVAAMENIS
jgi:hypothetical protein